MHFSVFCGSLRNGAAQCQSPRAFRNYVAAMRRGDRKELPRLSLRNAFHAIDRGRGGIDGNSYARRALVFAHGVWRWRGPQDSFQLGTRLQSFWVVTSDCSWQIVERHWVNVRWLEGNLKVTRDARKLYSRGARYASTKNLAGRWNFCGTYFIFENYRGIELTITSGKFLVAQIFLTKNVFMRGAFKYL